MVQQTAGSAGVERGIVDVLLIPVISTSAAFLDRLFRIACLEDGLVKASYLLNYPLHSLIDKCKDRSLVLSLRSIVQLTDKRELGESV